MRVWDPPTLRRHCAAPPSSHAHSILAPKQLVSRLGSDTLLVQQATTNSATDFLVGFIKVVCSITLMFLVSWQLTLIVFGALATYLLFLAAPLIARMGAATQRYQSALGRAANSSTETLGSMRTVRAFAAEMLEASLYAASVGDAESWCPSASTESAYKHGVTKAFLSATLLSSGFTIGAHSHAAASRWLGALRCPHWVAFAPRGLSSWTHRHRSVQRPVVLHRHHRHRSVQRPVVLYHHHRRCALHMRRSAAAPPPPHTLPYALRRASLPRPAALCYLATVTATDWCVCAPVLSRARARGAGCTVFGALNVSLWVAFVLITYGKLTIGRLTAFQAYQFQIIFGAAQLSGAGHQLALAMGGAARVLELLQRQPQIISAGSREPTEPTKGELTFDGVGFAYPTRVDTRVLDNFSLRVPANATTALVGASGCGKSTAVALLLRFYDVQQGAVTLDGHDVRELQPSWLRGKMALVQQEPVLFGMSVLQNVCYAIAAREAERDGREGREGHGHPREAALSRVAGDAEWVARAKQACKQAHADEFIQEFEGGYQTLVGERGVRLSGGQKQRLAIARALMAEPRVLLLDEATSALDTQSERLVQSAIERASSGRTVVVVAHRLSTVRDAEQIALVSNGRVEDAGRHEDLLRRCDAYRKLVQRQLSATSDDLSELEA